MGAQLPHTADDAFRQMVRGQWTFSLKQTPYLHVSLSAQPWPLLLALFLITAEFLHPARLWVVLLSGVLALILMTSVWALACTKGVRLERHIRHQWTQVGDLLEEQFTLFNVSAYPILAAEVEDQSNIPGYARSAVRAIPGRGRTSWRQTGRSSRRGVYLLGPTRVRFTDPLGLVEIVIDDQTTREVLVMPPVLKSVEVILAAGGGEGSTTARQRSLVETASAGGIRDYHPGDPIRRIHWPLSSRHQRFLVKEFDREMGGNIWLALDLDERVHSGEDDESSIENAVVWAASWVWHLNLQGKAVGLCTCGPERIMIPPRAGSGHLWAILRALALVKAQSAFPVAELIHEIMPRLVRGESLVVMTPSLERVWPIALMSPRMSAIARSVVLIDTPITSANSLLAMQALLNSLRIPTSIAGSRSQLEASPVIPGSGDWDFITTPTGGVVVRSRPNEVHP